MNVIKYGLFALAAVAAAVGIALTLMGNPWGVFGWTLGAVVAAAAVAMQSPRWGIAAASAVALGANGYLLYLKVRSSTEPAICSVNATIDCESINDSVYSVIFGGSAMETPITLLGLAFFTGLLIAAAAATEHVERFFQIAGLFGILNLLLTLLLASVLFIEQKLCIFCVSIYLSNIIVLVSALVGLKQTEHGLFKDLGAVFSDRSLWTVTTAFFALVVGGHVTGFAGNAEESVADVEDKIDRGEKVDLTQYYDVLEDPLELDGSEPTKGPEDAAYHVVEFADYLCGHCAEASKELKHWLPEQPDVKLSFKVFPLSGQCNPGLPKNDPPNLASCVAAVYADCAGQQGRFWEVNSDLYVNQGALRQVGYDPTELDRLVGNRGVNVAAVQQCVQDPEVQRGIGMDAVSGLKAGVRGTPTFFVKGVTPDGGWVRTKRGIEDLMRLIAAHRKQAANGEKAAAGAPGADEG